MSKDRHVLKIAVYAVLVKDNEVLLTRRKNTGWQDGNYSLPAGHLEQNETLVEAVIREAREEIGVDLIRETIRLEHTMHRQHLYIDFFFTAKWNGVPENLEPDKCDDIQWFSLQSLPSNVVPSVRHGITALNEGTSFSELEFGYDDVQSSAAA